jgi:putative aldouronate transport system substrate-binding protein
MKRLSKAISILCAAAIMATSCVACSKSAKTSEASSEKASYSDAPTLTWWTIGTQPTNLAKGLETINKYTYSKIGVKVAIKVASWGDWDDKMNTIVNSGEYYDMMFMNANKYNQYVSNGAYADLTSILKTYSPELYKFIPQNLWDGVKVNDKIYAVPTYKDSSMSQYWCIDDTYIKKYNLDINQITTMSALDKAMTVIKNGEGSNCHPMTLNKNDALAGLLNDYDDLALGFKPVGVKVTDNSRKVVSVLEQSDVMEKLEYLHKWYTEGIINPDAPTLSQSPKKLIFMSAQGWPGCDKTWATNNGIEKYDMVKVFGPLYSTSTIQGSMQCIYSDSKYKNEALKYLQLVNTDSTLRNMLAYGIEGENFEYTNSDKTIVKKLNQNWTLSAYTQGTFFDLATTDDAPSDQWEQVKKMNEDATNSSCLGFSLDISDMQTEVANCNSVWSKYSSELLTGSVDPQKMVSKIVSELNAAGMTDIISKAQKQIDSYFEE